VNAKEFEPDVYRQMIYSQPDYEPAVDASRLRGALRALRTDMGEPLPTRDVAGIIGRGTAARAGFSVLIALIAMAVLPWAVCLAWAGFILFWELLARPFLDGLAIRLARHSEPSGVQAISAINLIGGCAYAVFPITGWASQTPLGMVLATGWVCASAAHAFVYFASHRLLLIAVMIPIAAMVLVAPFAIAGISPITIAAVAALGVLVLSSGFVARDRELLLTMLARQATARAAAEQSDRAKSQFLATMSHELRTPLNAIIGYSEMIEEEGVPEVADDASKINTSARQLLGVINSILEVSKLEAGVVKIEKDKVDLAMIADQLREAAAPLAAANNNNMTVVEQGELGEAELDYARLHQCVMQLISNAAKFTRDGAINVRLARVTNEGRDLIQVVVADNGIGIPEDQRERIFEPFTQVETEAGRRFEGAGLGLTFARRVARLMGGDVACAATPGGGATFTLWVAA
jgi:signal transduction histidine kinase